jgi:hypothetical protein
MRNLLDESVPIAVLVVLAKSNRMQDLELAVPAIHSTLQQVLPRALCKVSA